MSNAEIEARTRKDRMKLIQDSIRQESRMVLAMDESHSIQEMVAEFDAASVAGLPIEEWKPLCEHHLLSVTR